MKLKSHHDDGSTSGKCEGHESHLVKEIEELAHLLFEWPIRQAPRLALPCCIFIAAIIQAGIIILFSISYQAPSELLPSSPQIYFLPNDSAVARKIAPWLEANDPAVFSPQHATRDALPPPPPLTYRPSYEEPPPPLRPLRLKDLENTPSVEPPPLPLISGSSGQQMHGPKSNYTPLPSHAVKTPQTIVRWQDDLGNRTVLPIVSTTRDEALPQATILTAQPALYQVGVSAEGLPIHCVLLVSSGDPDTDEVGSVWIHAQRFQPTNSETWGRVLILWGTPSHTRQIKGNGVSSEAIPTTTP